MTKKAKKSSPRVNEHGPRVRMPDGTSRPMTIEEMGIMGGRILLDAAMTLLERGVVAHERLAAAQERLAVVAEKNHEQLRLFMDAYLDNAMKSLNGFLDTYRSHAGDGR